MTERTTRNTPSLKELASKSLKSVQSREIMRDSDYKIDFVDTFQIVNEIETAHLEARGRIPNENGHTVRFINRSLEKRTMKRKRQEIDGARLESYNKRKHSFQIRIDDSEAPSFWCEVNIPMQDLKKWLEGEGISMTFNEIKEEDDEFL